MAEFDIALNQTNYKNQLKDKLLTVGQVQPSSDDDMYVSLSLHTTF